ncbi:aggrecan core protein [Diplodia corticola]|uniref:Aggrecan core protein n=1 Tax=Diplodia corticola TaxID=236234 RepID=A0A1J9S962_9PEZI|nr:aggrecan core protein [Diplodia corticola]OJD36117.1 aggrecan core protein [Diplodia corticola]
MALFAKVKKSKKTSDEQPKEPKARTTPTTTASAPVRPNLPRAHSACLNERAAYPKHTYTPQRPSNLRTSSSCSVRSLPVTPVMGRSATSEPSHPSRGRGDRKDLSIDSIMLSRSQDPSPNGHMMLHTRQADFKPSMYTYDPSKAPSLSGRKRQYRSNSSKPPTRASSFVMSPHIVTMVEEKEETDSSSSSTKSHESESSTQSQYLETARTTSTRKQQEQDEVQADVGTSPAPEIPARNPARNSICSRRTSVASNTEPTIGLAAPTCSDALSEPKTSATLVTKDRTESPGPKSKKRNWFNSKKRQSVSIEAH